MDEIHLEKCKRINEEHTYVLVVPEGWTKGWHVCVNCETSVACRCPGPCKYSFTGKEAS